jgi:insulysin
MNKTPVYHEVTKSPNDKFEYLYKTLPNGLRCLMIYDKEADKSAAALNVNIGSLLDPMEFQGLAHFLEHMLFMGTEKYPDENDFGDFLTKHSGETNAFTDMDSTNYHFEISNEMFIQALDKFAQFFIKPSLNKSAIEREMKAVESENKKNSRSDSDRFYELLRQESNASSPFCRFMIGNLQTLKKPKVRKALFKFYESYYSSHLMNLVVLSNIELKQMETHIDELFSTVRCVELTDELNYTPDLLYPYDENNLGYLYKVVPVKDKNLLEFRWFINENMNKYYKEDPLGYLTAIFGHEGPNSLGSSLIKEGLILSSDVSYDNMACTYSELYMQVVLTENGYLNYRNIINKVLAFVKLIQSKPIDKDFFLENQIYHKLDFEYFEKDDPLSFCTDIASNMTILAPEDTLTGSYLIEIYDEKMIRKYLDMLGLDNLNIYLTSQKLQNTEGAETWLTERWYGTKYKKEKLFIDPSHLTLDLSLDYPPRNKYIPQNFALIDLDNNIYADNKHPVKVKSDDYGTVWYKPDKKFKIPKVYIGAYIYLDIYLDHCEYHTLSSLWHLLFENDLMETVYMGRFAKINFSLYFEMTGMYLEVSGFSDTLHLFTKDIIAMYIDFKNKFLADPEKYKRFILINLDYMIQNKQNHFLSSASTQVESTLTKFLRKPHNDRKWELEYLKALKEEVLVDNYTKLTDFIGRFMKKSYFEWLIQGNITPEAGSELVGFIQTNLQEECMNLNNMHEIRICKIPDSSSFYHSFQSEDQENENSAIISYFQVGHLNERENCILLVIENILQEAFFDDLRTKQALGYIVSLKQTYHRKIEGIECLIQSNAESPEFIWSKINAFFEENHLEDILDEEEFKEYVGSVITTYQQKDLNLAEEFGNNFGEITIREYIFNRHEVKIGILKELTMKEVIDFFEEHFVNNVKRLDVQLVANKHVSDNLKYLEINTKQDDEDAIERVAVGNNNCFKEKCELFIDLYKNWNK